MRPVQQTILANDPQGRFPNCLQATLASIMEKELDQVPHFAQMGDEVWAQEMWNWVIAQGWNISNHTTPNHPRHYMLVIGHTERMTSHAVVYKDGVLAHDPHPEGIGLIFANWCAAIYR